MKLYFAPGACSLAPHIVAREAGIPLDLVKVDLTTHRLADGSDYYDINPRGYVPALELDDHALLTETAAVVPYLADLRPASGLAPPAGTMQRVRFHQWLTFIATELHKGFVPLWHPETARSTVVAATRKLRLRFDDLESHLDRQDYLLGKDFSAADAYAFAILSWTAVLRIDMAGYPAITAYLQRIAARPAVQAALQAEGLLRAAA
ncbi:glutathione transferase GstA [Luteimonas vadosa]|uniref:Glutathione transferase GstA n=1 Tax=Luteimonas vadosa TaxID=1165507 RepID=A0ABP9DYS0_9GAMM